MGALLTRLYGIDQTTPYAFKFSGITLWLLAADAVSYTHLTLPTTD